MFSEEFAMLAEYKDSTCITVIMPLQPPSADMRKADMQAAEQMIAKVSDLLREMCPAEESAVLLAGLRELAAMQEADNDPGLQGAGLYISPHFKKLLKFPFPVQERVVVAGAFALREALYLGQYAIGYLLLHINGKNVQCFKGNLGRLEEISDHEFPLHFRQEYEYNKPSRSTSYAGSAGEKSFERDKSVVQAERLQQFFREADKALARYLGALPLVVAGPKKDIALWEGVSRHQKNIIARVNGNYSHSAWKELAEKAWPLVRSWIDAKCHAALPELDGKTGTGLTAEGIRDVWKAARDGRAGKLLVEKDFACPGFADEKGELFLKPPVKPHRVLTDVPDEIIRMVLEKKGQVTVLQNNDLDVHQHIALITRY